MNLFISTYVERAEDFSYLLLVIIPLQLFEVLNELAIVYKSFRIVVVHLTGLSLCEFINKHVQTTSSLSNYLCILGIVIVFEHLHLRNVVVLTAI